MSQFLKISLYYSPCFFPKNGSEITQNFYCIFRYTLMSLCYVESLSRFRAQIFESWSFFKMSQFLKISLYYSPCFFPKKWLQNHPNFLLYFLMHIDALMLCRKFELIRSSNFQAMVNFKNGPISLYYSPCFFQKMAPKSPKIFIAFLDTH